jgi:hypothetical protein
VNKPILSQEEMQAITWRNINAQTKKLPEVYFEIRDLIIKERHEFHPEYFVTYNVREELLLKALDAIRDLYEANLQFPPD